VSTQEVFEHTITAGPPYHCCYNSHPGADDRRGSRQCSYSACTLARLAGLCALVEHVRHVPSNPNITRAELTELSRLRDAPAPTSR
jgi:hypothetical protein